MPSGPAPSSRHHPIFARFFSAVVVPQLDRGGGPERRQQLLAGLRGTVVEVGAGTGANFAHHPPGVERVVAVEPEPYLRDRALEAAAGDPRVEVVDGVAEALPLADRSVDAVVFCLVLCTVPSQPVALAEARRVLRPGGELRVFEHVLGHTPGRQRRVQRALDATVWPFFGAGCHCSRETESAIHDAGFTFSEIDRFDIPKGSRGPASPVILGRATPA